MRTEVWEGMMKWKFRRKFGKKFSRRRVVKIEIYKESRWKRKGV